MLSGAGCGFSGFLVFWFSGFSGGVCPTPVENLENQVFWFSGPAVGKPGFSGFPGFPGSPENLENQKT